ncbi:divergent polysaccharide deacetylase family protein [Paracraurococcus ruber]|uniref:divergent polysaccharide deacetylase family protein n=1 Tax=Paracraurococcus ruber TaxID=77675 RepID=UPI001057EB23|nr:divergent polysaccharide deacetylase family protein [Paracraurococcus ruber]TDG14327.1 divergent polysaccharide deacetylase family protein [Paracraurococcus ruber]
MQDAGIRIPGQAGRPTPALEPALAEAGPYGRLPRLGPDNRSSIRAYGRPFDRQDQRPRVGLVVGGLGMNAAVTEEAIRRLPGAVALAFSPYAPRPDLLLDQARTRGMELLVALPLEPTGYPLNNPGDRALLTGLSPSENGDRLLWVLSRFTGYVGAIGALGPMRGERYAMLTEGLTSLQAALHARGLLYVDPRPGAVRAPDRAWGRGVDLVVDEPATRSEIERKLASLEALARERGSALGYAGEASPVLVERIAAWANGVETRGVVLAPLTALIRRPEQDPPRGR